MFTTHRSRPARPAYRLASACLLALAAGLAFPTHASDWDQAQEAFAELDDRAARGHLRRAAAAGDARAQQAWALALRHGERLFPGMVQTDLAAAERWRQALGLSLLLPASAVPAEKHTRAALYVNAMQAWIMKEAAPSEVVFLDIRSRAEAAYVGMPTLVDALVPFREHDDQIAKPTWPLRRSGSAMRSRA